MIKAVALRATALIILLAHKHMEDILGQALEIALEQKDPKRKLEQRRKREKRAKQKSRPDEGKTKNRILSYVFTVIHIITLLLKSFLAVCTPTHLLYYQPLALFL